MPGTLNRKGLLTGEAVAKLNGLELLGGPVGGSWGGNGLVGLKSDCKGKKAFRDQLAVSGKNGRMLPLKRGRQ